MNFLDEKIKEKEEMYNDLKKDLEINIKAATNDYNVFLRDYRKELGYIRNNSNYSKQGKAVEAKQIQEKYLGKASAAGQKHIDEMCNKIEKWNKKLEEYKVENTVRLVGNKLPQLIYVSSMLGYITSLDSAQLVADIFDYVTEEENFCNELIDMVYIKSQNLINNSEENTSDQISDALIRGKYRGILNKINDKIATYKKDYSNDIMGLEKRFNEWKIKKSYPSNLYVGTDVKRDFNIPSDLNNAWGGEKATQTTPNLWY